MSEVRFPNPLFGVRLGKWERWLLAHAPHPQALCGLELDAPDPRIREQIRRAAKKLEKAGLLERKRMQTYVRARDPRREGVIFKDGRFWSRVDASRAHAVRRNVVWLTPFGAQIELFYRPQLEAGAPIRWDRETVLGALGRAHHVSREDQMVYINEREEAVRTVVIRGEDRWKLQPAFPDEVQSRDDVERWERVVAVARHRAPTAPAEELWNVARELWRSTDDETLRAQHAELPPQELSRNEQFRRRPRRWL